MNWELLALAIAVIIIVIVMAIVLYNFMLLLSEINKRLVYTISDILSNINLATPNVDSLVAKNEEMKLEDVIPDEGEVNSFNPHEFDVDAFKESQQGDNF